VAVAAREPHNNSHGYRQRRQTADFIRHATGPRPSFIEVLLEAGAIRFKLILLTALPQ
jgi:hypothetical protein